MIQDRDCVSRDRCQSNAAIWASSHMIELRLAGDKLCRVYEDFREDVLRQYKLCFP
jgi:hypothetical protein